MSPEARLIGCVLPGASRSLDENIGELIRYRPYERKAVEENERGGCCCGIEKTGRKTRNVRSE